MIYRDGVGVFTHSYTLKPAGSSSYCPHIRLHKSYIDELPTVPHIADNNKV